MAKILRVVVTFIGWVLIVGCNSVKEKEVVTEKIINAGLFEYEIPLPESVLFFGERVVLKDLDINERLQKEIASFVYNPYSLIGTLKRSKRYFPEFEKIAKDNHLPTDIKYLASIESNLLNVTSPAGAKGLWQIMESTGKQYGLRIDDEVDERLHSSKSTKAACAFLSWLRTNAGNWVNACAAYNRGLDGLKSDLDRQGVTHFFDGELNNETARYVFRIMAFKIVYENQEKYGIHLPESAYYFPISTQKISIEKAIPDLSKWALNKDINLKILRKLNPWLIGESLKNHNGITIEIPTNKSLLRPYASYQ